MVFALSILRAYQDIYSVSGSVDMDPHKWQIVHSLWDNYLVTVRNALPNGQISAEQARLAFVLLMKDQAY